MGDEEVSVVHDPGARRYVVRLGAEQVGFAAYRRAPDHTVFTHTEVDPHHQGRGLASALIRTVLDTERAEGREVEPRCSFVARYIAEHPAYEDLVPARFRGLVPPAPDA